MERLKSIPNGRWTLRNRATGEHRTFRVRTEKWTDRGATVHKTTIALLSGPDNTSDFENFGFVHEDGIDVWHRFQAKTTHKGRPIGRRRIDGSTWYPAWSAHQKMACMLWTCVTAGYVEMNEAGEHIFVPLGRDRLTLRSLVEKYDVLVEATCKRCNRVITRPDSIGRGYGPECWSKVGGEMFAATS